MSKNSRTTQGRHPWKATVRTIFQAVIGFVVMIPQIIEAANINEATPWVATALAISGAVSRIMALDVVEEWLSRFLPWLAADPDVSLWRAGKPVDS